MISKYMVKIDRAAGAANVIELKPSWAERMVQAVKYIVRPGVAPDWFGPGQPLPPIAPQILEGRQFDYPTTINLNTRPKTGENYPSVSFDTLRRIADSTDIIRLLIETRKDQLCKLEWSVVPRNEKAKIDKRCVDIQEFFNLPDKEHTWDEWLRMLLEDQTVIDAATLYPRLARDGSLYALEPIDGATIKRIVDDYGRTPQAPYPAYQQYIKGVQAFDYTRDQLIYRPRNLRTHRLYGFSVVEQIIVTITLALNRQAYQMQYYTEGSTPDLIMSCPPEWSPKQVEEFSAYWDSRLEGNDAKRRGTMFVYNGMDTMDTKEKILTDKFDEWLARVSCYAFGMSPQPFVEMMNRATAQTASDQAKEEGVGPVMKWVKNVIDYIIAKHMGAPDLQFKWKDVEDVDPKVQEDITDTRLRNGSLTVNEAREARGQEPVEGGDVCLIYTGTGAVPLAAAVEVAQASLDASKALADSANADESDAPTPGMTDDKPTVEANVDDTDADGPSADYEKLRKVAPLRVSIAAIFKALARSVAAQVTSKMAKVTARDVEDALAAIDLSALGDLQVVLVNALGNGFGGAYSKATKQVRADPSIRNLAATEARTYASARAGELIGAGPKGGELGESTRLLIRGTIEQALENNWDTETLANELASSYGFSAQRAELIADNELQTSVMRGQYDGWKASGQVAGKRWLLSNDEGICDVCQGNADEGVIDIDALFSSGDDSPPAHPHCRCDMVPVLKDDED